MHENILPSAVAKPTVRGSLGGIVFAALFFAIGMGFLVIGVIPNLLDWTRMQGWVAVPAQIQSVKLDSQRGSDSTTYRVISRYQYTFDHRDYTGERVGISGGSDNIGDWHSDTYHRMRAQAAQSVWVNPDDPSQAVYDRDLRWELVGFKMIFVIVFGVFGGGLLWYLLRKRSEKRIEGVPLWQSLPAWRENKIYSNAKLGMYFAWGFAILWNAISVPIAFVVPAELAKGNQAVLLALVFPLFGAGIVIYAIRMTLNWHRFGRTPLSLQPFPGQIGGVVSGSVEVRLAHQHNHQFNATLTCSRVSIRRGKNSSTQRHVQWQDEQRATLEHGMQGSRVRFSFKPDAQLPPSSDPDERSHTEWTLRIYADLAGTDFDRSWVIPVFNMPGLPNEAHATQETAQARERRFDRSNPPVPIAIPENLLSVQTTGQGLALKYPVLRNASVGAVLLLVGCIFSGVLGAYLFTDWGIPVVIAGGFGLFGIGAMGLGLYLLANSLSVTVTPSAIHTIRRILGFSIVRSVNSNEIAELEKSITMQSNSGGQHRVYYALHANTTDGRKIALGDGLPSAGAADQVLDLIRQALRRELSANAPESIHNSLATSDPQADPDVRKRIKKIRRWANIFSALCFFGVMYWQFGDGLADVLDELINGGERGG